MPISEFTGYLASMLVLTAFWMRQMTPLRLVAVASNLAFISYALQLHLEPILVLHGVLLPLNLWRLVEQSGWYARGFWRPARQGG